MRKAERGAASGRAYPGRFNPGVAALLIAVIIWGSTFIITKSVLAHIGPFTLTVLRFLIAFVVLVPFACRHGFRPRLATRPMFLLFGLTGVALYFGLQNLGLKYTSAASAALIQAAIPAVTAALSMAILREQMSSRQLIGIAFSVVGVLLVSGTGAEGDALTSLLGNILIIVSVLAWAAYTVQGKRLASGFHSLVATTASIAAGLLLLLPMAAGELWVSGLPSLSAQSVLLLLYLGCVASALTLFLWNYALRYVNATVAAPYTNLIPVVGLAGAVLLGESIGLAQLAGGLLAMAGVWLGSD